jgi:hypothetical protein
MYLKRCKTYSSDDPREVKQNVNHKDEYESHAVTGVDPEVKIWHIAIARDTLHQCGVMKFWPRLRRNLQPWPHNEGLGWVTFEFKYKNI